MENDLRSILINHVNSWTRTDSVLCKIFAAVLFKTINSSTSNERTKKKIKKSEGHSKNSKALIMSL